MKILVVGSGGREHALVWKINQSPSVSKIYCAPGNGGISRLAECVDIQATDVHSLSKFAKQERVGLTVVGPEVPLTMGMVDEFEKEGLRIFGAGKKSAEIEGSKSFAKDLMRKYGIPTAEYRTFISRDEAAGYIREKGAPLVIKADGLAAGKGVIPAKNIEEALDAVDLIIVKKAFGEAGNKIVVEEFLTGEEASFLVFTDGESVIPLPTSQDHKPIFDEDKGPNTGGMGAYSPAPIVTEDLHRQIMKEIIQPTISGMAAEGRKYKGVLYAGLMITDGKAKVLEFNARFGDPETQPLLMRMKSDIIPVLEATIDGNLSQIKVEWDERAAVCVVMASEGYPGSYQKGFEIYGLEETLKMPNVEVFHSGTVIKDGKIISSGGRVLGVTALEHGIKDAIGLAYRTVKDIHWEGVYYRQDIGRKALNCK
ncbi:MAG: phosphoribosylamine--glycine ligase [Desulfobacterales bacterium]|nr:phosphoribosylamine--glycine ligase [Desulfobacterales bacterium]